MSLIHSLEVIGPRESLRDSNAETSQFIVLLSVGTLEQVSWVALILLLRLTQVEMEALTPLLSPSGDQLL